MNRLGLFLIYDKQGIVDDYIVYMLEHMCNIFQHLVIVCNGFVENKEIKKLMGFTNDIIIRDNIGFDAGGFKDALCNHIGWDRINEYDELLLFNDSCYGPFFSVEKIFSKMEDNPCDFWCMTKNTGNVHSGVALQSYFIVVRKRLLNSFDFRKYWTDMPYYSSFKDVVVEYEMKFADYFVQRGYSWDSYINNKKYDVAGDRKYRMSLYHTVPNEIIFEQGYPFLKRKLFDLDSFGTDYGLDKQTKENFLDTIKYVEEHLGYDTDLIWKNVLRTYSLRNIQDCCCLRELIYEHGSQYKNENKKIFMWLYDQPDVLNNIASILDEESKKYIYIGTNSSQLYEVLREKYKTENLSIHENSNDYWIFVFNNFQALDSDEIVCFFNDYVCDADANEPYVTKKSYMWNRWENILKSKTYIGNISSKFAEQRRLGLIVAPRPMHGCYIANEYSTSIANEVSEALGVRELVNRSRFAADYSESFWIRGNILNLKTCKTIIGLLKRGFEFKDISRAIPYVCQKVMFYTSIGETDLYFKTYSQMQEVYLRFFIDRVYGEHNVIPFGMLNKYLNLKELYENALKEFTEIYDRVFIYGCGEIAEMICNLNVIKNICGFIISDNMRGSSIYKGFPVYKLSECLFDESDCVIVALNDKNSEQIRSNLLNMINLERIFFLKSGGRF